jgi:hypothetical protein
MQEQHWHFYELHFSKERMRIYVALDHNETLEAQRLFEWEARASSAFWEVLAHLEVSLRSLLDRRMIARSIATESQEQWSIDPKSEIRIASRRMASELNKAIDRVKRQGKPLTHSAVVSELPLGFWVTLASRKFQFLWPDLVSGFLGATSRDLQSIQAPLQEFRKLRNLIGHHHPIVNQKLDVQYQEILALATNIDPRLATWISSRSRVPKILSERPSQTTQE